MFFLTGLRFQTAWRRWQFPWAFGVDHRSLSCLRYAWALATSSCHLAEVYCETWQLYRDSSTHFHLQFGSTCLRLRRIRAPSRLPFLYRIVYVKVFLRVFFVQSFIAWRCSTSFGSNPAQRWASIVHMWLKFLVLVSSCRDGTSRLSTFCHFSTRSKISLLQVGGTWEFQSQMQKCYALFFTRFYVLNRAKMFVFGCHLQCWMAIYSYRL